MCLPSVPAQLEVINTGNLIQRQETPLPPTEFKLNALLFFLAKSRFTWLEPAQPDVDLAAQFSQVTHRRSDRPSQFQSRCCRRFIAEPFIGHSPQQRLLFNIPIRPAGPEHSGIFMESLFYLFFFKTYFFIATVVQIGPPQIPYSLPLQ